MKEVIWHGRGGQGVVVASSILGLALAVYEGKYAMSIPGFGGQRRDAPLVAVTRVSETPIHKRGLTVDADYIVIIDDTLTSTAMTNVGHEKTRHIIVNSKKSASDLNLTGWQPVTIVDVEAIASKITESPITNTVMVVVVAGATGLARLESVKKATADVFGPGGSGKNIAGAEAGFLYVRS